MGHPVYEVKSITRLITYNYHWTFFFIVIICILIIKVLAHNTYIEINLTSGLQEYFTARYIPQYGSTTARARERLAMAAPMIPHFE